MTDQPCLIDLPEPARHRGRIGAWSDRVKALALLVLLAVAGGVLGVATGSVGDAGAAREGVANAGSGLRTSLPALPVTLLAGHPDDQHPDHGDGGDPAPRALSPADVALPMPGASIARPVVRPVASPARNGHDARMPTGPPARLSF